MPVRLGLAGLFHVDKAGDTVRLTRDADTAGGSARARRAPLVALGRNRAFSSVVELSVPSSDAVEIAIASSSLRGDRYRLLVGSVISLPVRNHLRMPS